MNKKSEKAGLTQVALIQKKQGGGEHTHDGTGLEMGNLEDPAHLKRDRRCPQGAREQARCVWP